jgi:membrane protein
MTDRPRAIATRFIESVRNDDLTGLAAEIAYRFLFAVFPFGLFGAALGAFVAGWLGIDNPAQQVVDALGDNLPPDLAGTLQPELERVIGTARPDLLSIGALAALWAATGGTNALIKAMNRAYDVEESRPFLGRLLLAIGLTLLASAGILVSFVTIVGGALITEQIAEQLGLTGAAWTAITLLRWPAVFLVLVVAVAILYRLAPNLRVAWRWTFAGAALFAAGWLVATWGFAWYVGNMGNYGATYGALGSVIVLMLWFYLTGLLLVGAATLTAAAASVVEPESLQRRRDEIAAERGASETAKRAAGQAVGAVRSAVGGGDREGEERHDRRRGPRDRRRGVVGAG